MSIAITVNNGKVVKLKLAETFGDLFDNSGEKGKIAEVDFVVDGNIIQVQKNTKLSQYFSGRDQASVQIQKKGSQAPTFQAPPTFGIGQPQLQPPSFQGPPQAPFGQQPQQQQQPTGGPPIAPFGQTQQLQQPQSGFPQPPKPAPQAQNPPVAQPGPGKFPAFPGFPGAAQAPVLGNFQAGRKTIQYRSDAETSQELKQVDVFTVKICDKGNRVELEDTANDFRAIFLEENAKPERVQNIKQQLSPTAYITDPQQIAKLTVGVNNEYTKVIFKNDYRGIAIQWATGLYTLCEFNIQP